MQLVNILVQILVSAIILRVWLQVVSSNYHNPITKKLVAILSPVINLLGNIFPSIGRFNTAAFILALVLIVSYGYFVVFVAIPWPQLIMWAGLQLVSYSLNIIFWMIIASVILSWVVPSGYHPIVELINEAIAPIVEPIRKIVPPFGGLDFSPIIIFIFIHIFRGFVLAELYQLAGLPPAF